MNTIIILYKTDKYHSVISQTIIGLFTDKNQLEKKAKKLIKNHLKQYEIVCDDFDEYCNYYLSQLIINKQTQGMNDFELMIEEVEINKIFNHV